MNAGAACADRAAPDVAAAEDQWYPEHYSGTWYTRLATIADGAAFPGRAVDYLLDGHLHAPGDRAAARRWLAVNPQATQAVLALRNFLRRAMEDALDRGVIDFVDLATGADVIGAPDAMLRTSPWARISYVCPDALAFAIARAEGLAARHHAVAADPLTPVAAWTQLLIDWRGRRSTPVALLAVGLTELLADPATDLAAVLGAWRGVVPQGSLLVLSGPLGDAVRPGPDPEHELERTVEQAGWTVLGAVERAQSWQPGDRWGDVPAEVPAPAVCLALSTRPVPPVLWRPPRAQPLTIPRTAPTTTSSETVGDIP
ncbi:SAM-dependent methyltransferase [Nocardia sp. NRRL S-836]|uniref:SAM-dependent methyltransferase n=1 Tax=Nocardia sp. NRRL S-836 TaxID=1519492 RepID=UPI0006AF2FF3|nr:SAM-dependent methyltransferase [Nocardia sp. NRRL S-836]KOV84662.1 hypothetical protein ADL03_15355 [Nocardia sp. NRRL S-836]